MKMVDIVLIFVLRLLLFMFVNWILVFDKVFVFGVDCVCFDLEDVVLWDVKVVVCFDVLGFLDLFDGYGFLWVVWINVLFMLVGISDLVVLGEMFLKDGVILFFKVGSVEEVWLVFVVLDEGGSWVWFVVLIEMVVGLVVVSDIVVVCLWFDVIMFGGVDLLVEFGCIMMFDIMCVVCVWIV